MKSVWPHLAIQEREGVFFASVGIGYPDRFRAFYLPRACSLAAARRLVTPAFDWLVEQELADGYISHSIAGNLKMQFDELVVP